MKILKIKILKLHIGLAVAGAVFIIKSVDNSFGFSNNVVKAKKVVVVSSESGSGSSSEYVDSVGGDNQSCENFNIFDNKNNKKQKYVCLYKLYTCKVSLESFVKEQC